MVGNPTALCSRWSFLTHVSRREERRKIPRSIDLFTPDDPLAAMLPLSKDVGDKEECCETSSPRSGVVGRGTFHALANNVQKKTQQMTKSLQEGRTMSHFPPLAVLANLALTLAAPLQQRWFPHLCIVRKAKR